MAARGKRRTKEEIEKERENLVKEMSGESTEPEDAELLNDPLFSSGVKERDYSSKKGFDIRGEVPDSTPEPEDVNPIIDLTTDSLDNSDNETDGYDSSSDSGNTNSNTDNAYDEPKSFGGGGASDSYTEEPVANQKELSNNFADSIIDGYKLLIDLTKKGLKNTPEKYRQKAIEGKFDMRVLKSKVDVGGQYVTFQEFVESYNESIEEILVLDPDSEKEMRDLLKRIAKKRGLGMSDEQRFFLLFGKDVVTKTVSLVSMHKTMRNVEKNQQKILLGMDEDEKPRAKKSTKVTEEDNNKKSTKEEVVNAELMSEPGEGEN